MCMSFWLWMLGMCVWETCDNYFKPVLVGASVWSGETKYLPRFLSEHLAWNSAAKMSTWRSQHNWNSPNTFAATVAVQRAGCWTTQALICCLIWQGRKKGWGSCGENKRAADFKYIIGTGHRDSNPAFKRQGFLFVCLSWQYAKQKELTNSKIIRQAVYNHKY